MAEDSAGPSSAKRQSWRRPPAWPDGRLLHPNDDRTAKVILSTLTALLALWIWALGRTDSFNLPVGDSWWILAAGLLAASVLCFLVARRRVWRLAARSSVGAVQPQSTHPRVSRWWCAPRWPDGRLVAVKDPVVTVLLLACSFAAYGTLLLLGHAGVPPIAISGYQEFLVPALQLTALSLLWAMVIRNQVVRAVAEGWTDADKQLGFIERRIAALAADAKRASARFASTE